MHSSLSFTAPSWSSMDFVFNDTTIPAVHTYDLVVFARFWVVGNYSSDHLLFGHGNLPTSGSMLSNSLNIGDIKAILLVHLLTQIGSLGTPVFSLSFPFFSVNVGYLPCMLPFLCPKRMKLWWLSLLKANALGPLLLDCLANPFVLCYNLFWPGESTEAADDQLGPQHDAWYLMHTRQAVSCRDMI